MSTLSPYLQIGLQERKLFLMDSRYPTLHLTVSWNNPSGEIDIHLTREFPDKPKIYGPIAKITKDSFQRFLESFVPRLGAESLPLLESFRQGVKPLRPGWLGRKGYLIFWVPEDEHTQWVTRFAHRHKKNKYRVFQSSLAQLDRPEEVLEHLYDPAILHEIAARGGRGWVQALRIKGKKRRRRSIISLISTPWPDGTVRWIAIDSLAAALRDMMGRMEDSIFQPIVKAIRDALSKVYDGLHLHELGIDRDQFTSF